MGDISISSSPAPIAITLYPALYCLEAWLQIMFLTTLLYEGNDRLVPQVENCSHIRPFTLFLVHACTQIHHVAKFAPISHRLNTHLFSMAHFSTQPLLYFPSGIYIHACVSLAISATTFAFTFHNHHILWPSSEWTTIMSIDPSLLDGLLVDLFERLSNSSQPSSSAPPSSSRHLPPSSSQPPPSLATTMLPLLQQSLAEWPIHESLLDVEDLPASPHISIPDTILEPLAYYNAFP